jgi:hypothetical protein
MAERVVLHPPAHDIEGPVGQSNRVEVIHHHDGVGQARFEGVGVAPEGVGGRYRDLGPPGRRLGVQPIRDHRRAATSHDVDQPSPVQVDVPRHIARPLRPPRMRESGLVHPDRPGRGGAGRVIDQWLAVAAHRRHGRRPADTEPSGRCGNRHAILTNLPADLRRRSRRQQPARLDAARLLSPRAHLTVRVGAPPDPLRPPQHHRPSCHRQIPNLDLASPMADRTAAALDATDDPLRRLHRQPPLAVHLHLDANLETGHANQRGRAATTVELHRRSSILHAVRSRKNAEDLRRAGGSLCPSGQTITPHAPTRRAGNGELRKVPGGGCAIGLILVRYVSFRPLGASHTVPAPRSRCSTTAQKVDCSARRTQRVRWPERQLLRARIRAPRPGAFHFRRLFVEVGRPRTQKVGRWCRRDGVERRRVHSHGGVPGVTIKLSAPP